MVLRCLSLGLLSLAVASSQGNLPLFLNGRPAGGFLNTGYRRYVGEDQVRDGLFPGQEMLNFSQKVDHFDEVNVEMWQQKYFHNPSFVDASKNGNQDIIFLMVGGEGKESAKWSGDENVRIVHWAKQFGARIFDLEHRFFGDSWPIPDMTTHSLRLLTTEQALADLAFFITSMNQEFHFKDPKWITFGGSYPGALSAMFRSKYPELTVGAVASSAPLLLQLDFYQYADVVQNVLNSTDLPNGDSRRCVDIVQQSFEEMQRLSLSLEGRNQLNDIFRLSPKFTVDTTKDDINNFFANIYNIFQGMIQYTYDGSRNETKYDLTAAQLCRIMSQGNSANDYVKNVWELIKWYNVYELHLTNDANTVFANSYTDLINEMAATNLSSMSQSAQENRGWMWLCCNEMGWLQTTDSDSIFGSTLPINYFFDMCTDMFSDDSDHVKVDAVFIRDKNMRARNFYGGEDSFEATNLILPNGKFDPWHALGYYKQDDKKNIQVVTIEGAAHCSDMYPPYDGEPADLTAARQKIENFLKALIDAKPSIPSSTAKPEPESSTKSSGLSSIAMAFVVSTVASLVL